jgi:hypothetical protein
VDNELLLDLARKSADSVIHPAAPVTTFLVGYAAGLEAGTGSAGAREASSAAVARAASIAFGLCDDGHDGGPASQGWTDTAVSNRSPVIEPVEIGPVKAQVPAGSTTRYPAAVGSSSSTRTGSSFTITALDAGVWLPSATLSSGTRTLASG